MGKRYQLNKYNTFNFSMAHMKQTARNCSSAKGQGTSATGTGHLSIRQLLAKLPRNPNMDPVPAAAPATAQTSAQPAQAIQISQPYGGLQQDSQQGRK